jgi:DNA-binding LacI/PurR family transcriptional regulator
VWVHSNVWRPQNCIRRDEVHAGEETARVLLNQGYKKLAWVGPPAINPKDPDRHHSEAQRLQGVRSIAAKNNIELIEIIADDPGQMLDHHALFSDLLRPEVGVVVYSAHYASWLTQCTQSLGRIAPYDFGLVCCDDSLAIKHRWPGLSRMGFSLIHMGRQAGAMMLKNLKQKEGKGIPSVMIRDPWVPGNTAWGPQAAAYRPT